MVINIIGSDCKTKNKNMELVFNTCEKNNPTRIIESHELFLFLDVNDIAHILRISKHNAYELIHKKGFPSIKIGKRYVVPKPAFQKWLENPFVFDTEGR